MTAQTIEAQMRSPSNKGTRKRLRKAGTVMGVIYGRGHAPLSIMLAEDVVRQRIAGHRVVRIECDGVVHPSIVQRIHRHPISRHILDVEFHEVVGDEKTEASVPLILQGLEAVEKRGGIVQQQTLEVTISAKLDDIPEWIALDIGHLNVGEVMHMRDVTLPSGVDLAEDPGEIVISVLAPKATVADVGAAPDAVERTTTPSA
ncbi:50S ribosomal protein L25 [Ferroacidibacillus organovorans]|uniref:Large ribosomal subunit protein bL25 n=1 Tax=Ferroacidibacillus organovorans TaxID=1765683 RepID=A0A162TYQ3_9BACL|nr:50S ribosomal protein L25 [Ferroacidibacillus organovorans]KYP81252.1 hypothetical protein AYJ22_08005 [Ferroacidibacillus organovorans]OAG93774.1 hypothetical protein AYW79_09020 [Ferroacidibacillus organovorans]OPG16842.1 hypothetical protein B2M26_04350 [Ferroacidibacillus organovorans]